MSYKSNAQAAFMHIHHPSIAKKWDEEGAKVEPDYHAALGSLAEDMGKRFQPEEKKGRK